VCGFAVKAHQQGTKLIDPGKCPFAGKAQFVDRGVEQAFASAFVLFAGTFVFHNVGNDMVVETRPASGFGVKGSIGIEVAACDGKAKPLDELDGGAQVVLQLEGIIVVACYDACGCQDEPSGVGDGQHVGGLGFLPSLIRHCLTAFLGWRVAAVEVQVMRVDLLTDAQDALLEHALQAAIPTAFAIVMVDAMIADFFFVRRRRRC
jgi:hypothetical protein